MKIFTHVLVCLLVGCITFKSFSQLNKYPHGTLIVAVICEDGIVISADSRTSYAAFDSSGKETIIAYSDSCRKIFPFGNFQIGITGNLNVGNTFWWDVIEKYNKIHNADTSLEAAFNKFKYYLTVKLNIADSSLKDNSFIVAGYEKMGPAILYADSLKTPNVVKAGKIKMRIMSRDCIRQKLFLDEYYCKDVSIILQEGYSECGNSIVDIGGPLNILKINADNSITEMKTFRFKRFKNVKTFLLSILQGKIKMTYLYQDAESTLKKNIIFLLKQKIK